MSSAWSFTLNVTNNLSHPLGVAGTDVGHGEVANAPTPGTMIPPMMVQSWRVTNEANDKGVSYKVQLATPTHKRPLTIKVDISPDHPEGNWEVTSVPAAINPVTSGIECLQSSTTGILNLNFFPKVGK